MTESLHLGMVLGQAVVGVGQKEAPRDVETSLSKLWPLLEGESKIILPPLIPPSHPIPSHLCTS